MVLSLVVALDVFWVLRQPGLTLAGDASCGILEHSHDDSCIRKICICDIPEETHIHGEGCYETTFVEASEETVLICDLPAEYHTHTDDCFVKKVIEAHEERTLVCSISENPHIHEDSCYKTEIQCGYEEHTHSIECYSDKTADVETLLDWQKMFADYPFTGDLRQDLAGIASTQVGYSESTLNFEVGSDGIRRGYTRYGAWYGTPYSDWSAMFVSFCLHYAGSDPNEFPGNTGADAMANAWDSLGKYAPTGGYRPSSGDLVFFSDNTVGIVTEVHNATCYVIQGDVNNAVGGALLSLDDNRISGWGLTEGTAPTAESPADPSEDESGKPASDDKENSMAGIETDELLDISNGPAFFIFAGETAEPQIMRFARKSARTVTDLAAYLKNNNGSYFYTLVDTNNKALPKDDNGNYIVTAGISYKLTLTINNPKGFLPGTYQYQIPNGLLVNGGVGDFILSDGTNVGDWEVTDEGLITINFNEHINSRTDITISATMGIIFPEHEDPLNFDGKITVTIEPPLQAETFTKLNKWGKQGVAGSEEGKTDPSKLYWTVEIVGRKDSAIPGSVITDQIKTGAHRYTQSDMERGIEFGASEYDPTTGETEWHSWTVYPGDPNLTWTETGWSYTIPEEITCWCGEVTLGNENWTYYVNYSSTPDPLNTSGAFWYTNSATVDGQYAQGWGKFSNGEVQSAIVKQGSFHGDADDGFFLWEFQATVPGRPMNEKAAYYTQIMDQLRVKNAENVTFANVHNDADKSTVTAAYNGRTITVPHVEDATEEDPFAWVVGWSSQSNGVFYTRALLPLCRCNCTEQTCHYWDATNQRCGAFHYLDSEWGPYPSGFCYCWTPEQDITFTFTYKTKDPSLIETFGGQNKDLQNEVVLQQTVYQPDGSEKTQNIGDAQARVPIPGVFRKKLTQDFNGYTAHYNITVNEAKLVLTNGSPLTILDEMTPTLAYISGSLVITTSDANGKQGVLQQGTDYTVTYDGTGNRTDGNKNPVHVLEIIILRPQPVMYTLDYDATLIIPDKITESIEYGNSAYITLWGEKIKGDSEEKIYSNFNIAAKSFQVEVFKTAAETGEPLGGAQFGIFNENGGLITTGETDANGKLTFKTNVTQGIILQEHVLYYLQELKPPPGYRQDDTKHWFCFCSKTEDSCQTCDKVMAGQDATRIPFEQIGIIPVSNELMHYNLPATGGPGIYPFVLIGAVFIITPLIYGFIRRRKQERRGVG